MVLKYLIPFFNIYKIIEKLKYLRNKRVFLLLTKKCYLFRIILTFFKLTSILFFHYYLLNQYTLFWVSISFFNLKKSMPNYFYKIVKILIMHVKTCININFYLKKIKIETIFYIKKIVLLLYPYFVSLFGLKNTFKLVGVDPDFSFFLAILPREQVSIENTGLRLYKIIEGYIFKQSLLNMKGLIVYKLLRTLKFSLITMLRIDYINTTFKKIESKVRHFNRMKKVKLLYNVIKSKFN